MGAAPSNLFNSIEPHCHLPNETCEALWAACVRVKDNPREFTEAATGLDREYSESAVLKRKLKDSERIYRNQLRGAINGLDPCDTFARRRALRKGMPREQMVQLTIEKSRSRGRTVDGDQSGIFTPSRGVPVDESNVDVVWRTLDDEKRSGIRQIRDERRERDDRSREDAKSRMGRFLEAVQDAVEKKIPVVNRVECSRRLVLLAAIISSPEPLSISKEFADMPWASEGNLLGISFRGIGGPYVSGRETLFEKHDFLKGATQCVIAGFMADGFGNLIARALNVLPAIIRETVYVQLPQNAPSKNAKRSGNGGRHKLNRTTVAKYRRWVKEWERRPSGEKKHAWCNGAAGRPSSVNELNAALQYKRDRKKSPHQNTPVNPP